MHIYDITQSLSSEELVTLSFTYNREEAVSLNIYLFVYREIQLKFRTYQYKVFLLYVNQQNKVTP